MTWTDRFDPQARHGERLLQRLPKQACLALLRLGGVGRLAFVQGPAPVILPVNFACDTDGAVFRTAPDSALGRVPEGTVVALEIDEVDSVYHTGWSVLVQGRLVWVTDPDEVERCEALPLGHYAPGDRTELRRIDLATVSGRRIV